jgi:preprotein translocase subunit SecA
VSRSAGNGIDIPLSKTSSEKGGLHLILSSVGPDSRSDRIDESWCGRRGEPGTVETLLCLRQELFFRTVRPWILGPLRLLFRHRALPNWLGRTLLRHARSRATREDRALLQQRPLVDVSSDPPFLVTQPRRQDRSLVGSAQ